MLEVKNLVKTYKSKSGVTVKALDNISLKFPKTGMVFILGKSGSGKSTLLNVLGGLDSFDSGDIIVKGESTHHFKQSHFDSFRNTYVGFIFQEYNILDNLTVGQNIALAMQLQSRKPTNEDINDILNEVDLKGLGDRKPNELSGGQKQRVAIARALIKKPEIIMADEPTGALDSNTGIQIFDTLKKLSKNKLVIIISHDREFSERYADRIIELKDGQIISDVSVSNTTSKKTDEDNLMFSGNEVIVKSDYELTAKDLKIINAYIKKHKKDISIKGENGTKKKVTAHFIETKEDKIESDTGGFSLIKSRLPMKRAFQMGASGLKHKKFKLGMTIILSLVAFTMLGASITIALTNENTAIANALSNSSYTQTSISKYRYSLSNFAGNVIKMRENIIGLTDSETKEVDNYLGGNTIKVNDVSLSSTNSDNEATQQISISGLDSSYSYLNLYMSNANRFADASVDDLKNAGYTILYNQGGLSDNGVFISKYAFDCFKIKNLKYKKGTEEHQLNDSSIFENTLLGGKLTLIGSTNTHEITINGMFHTGFDLMNEKYNELLKSSSISSFNINPLVAEIVNANQSDLDGVVVGGSGFSNKIKSICGDTTYQTSKLRTTGVIKNNKLDNNSAKALMNKLSKELSKSGNTIIKYSINNQMVSNLESTLNNMAPLRVVFLYVGLAFVVFSGLLLANFIANSISYQKREIGILRAIGARGKDVFKIYISEAAIIATTNFILSSISTWVVLKFAISPQVTKITAGFNIIKFGILEILILLGVSFLSAFIATYIPVYKTARKKPVDAIRNK